MDSLIIQGGNPLRGKIKISGAKNAALPLMACGLLLSKGSLELTSFPKLADTNSMATLLINLGLKIEIKNDNALIFGRPNNFNAPYDLVNKMRASILVLGPLLTRFGSARVSLPGGCSIGTRPVDLHIKAMKALGAKVKIIKGYVEAQAPKEGLKGCIINFPKVSVGATENTIMAASLAKGETIITNAAKEPEIINLANCLNEMGAKISGAGTNEIKITGVKDLVGTKCKVISDRIETGSYAIASLMTKGELELNNAEPLYLSELNETLLKSGAIIKTSQDKIFVSSKSILPVNVETSVYPGFPTDLQAQFMSLMCIANGKSEIKENIFENRFMHVPELIRMGAKINVNGGIAKIKGVKKLNGAPIMATDLRASISLVIAALSAKGESQISNVFHLDRGYEDIENKLSNCGAKIKRVFNK